MGSRRNEVHSRTVNIRSVLKEKGQTEQRIVRLDGGMKSLYFVCMFESSCHWTVVAVHTQVSMVQQLLNKMRDRGDNIRFGYWSTIIQIRMNSPMQSFHDAELAKVYLDKTFLSQQQKLFLQMQEWPPRAVFCTWLRQEIFYM